MHLVADVLDKQVTDRERQPLGRVDGIVILTRRGLPPRVAFLELGTVTLARRLHPRLARWVEWIERRFGVHQETPLRLNFDRITSVGLDVRVDVDGRRTTAFVWEDWWRGVLRHIPGARSPKE